MIHTINVDSHVSLIMERLQCVISNIILSNDSLKPTKSKQHLHNVHQQHKDKSRSFFERNVSAFKKMRLDSNGTYHVTNKNAIEASNYGALKIARQKNRIQSVKIL